MSDTAFGEDSSSRKVTRVLLLLQIAGMGLVLALSRSQLSFLALALSILMLIVLVANFVWLYYRYRRMPVIREKDALKRLQEKFQKRLETDEYQIQSAERERERLNRAQKEETDLALLALQQDHVQAGLANASIQEAAIPGVGPKLKERLATQGILSAAQIAGDMAHLSGFGEAKHQALIGWRDSVLESLERTKPGSLTDSELDSLEQKFQSLHAKNDAEDRQARVSKQILKHELASFKLRSQQLAPLTFSRYLSTALAEGGRTAGLLAFALIASQLLSSVSATTSAIRAFRVADTAFAQATVPPPAPSLPAPTDISMAVPSTTELASETPAPLMTASPVWTMTAVPALALPATLPPGIAACIPQNTARETALVVGVVDGDTIDVSLRDQVYRVRYIGINSPEQDAGLYSQATAYNQQLVDHQTVTLVKDISETDGFNRLLRYVIVGDTFVNHELVLQGYASASAYAPDTACIRALEEAQRQAQAAQLVMWMPTPEPYVAPVTGGDCDPSYPGVCIAPAPPDLDCRDVPHRRFQVLPPDPHGFDGDQDGVGCES